MRRNWWLIGLTIATILAVAFSSGPMQRFRAMRGVGALRVLRAKQVAKACESLAKRGRSRWLGQVLATSVVGTFVVLALVVPESEARTTLEQYVGEESVPFAAAIAGLLTVVMMYFLVRTPRRHRETKREDRSSTTHSQ